MQKKLITLAVAGILAAPMMAQAAVEVYGQARMSVGMIGDDNAAAGADDSSIAVTSHASRLGFRGNEDLGGGLKALYQIEGSVDMDNGGNLNADRNTFVGLAGGFGTVILGQHDTPYKISTAKLDPFVDTYADYNAVINATHDARLDNVIAYISPDMSGFTLAAAYVSDINNDNLPDASSTIENDAISIAGMYSNGPLYVSLAIQSVSDYTGTNGEDADAMKLGLGYTLPTQTTLGLVYENTEVSITGAPTDQDAIYFAATHPITADTTVKLAIGQLDESTSGAKDGGDFLALGVSKNLTANAEVYALYTQFDGDTGAPTTAGLSEGGGPDISAANKTASALAVGMNIKFSSM